MAFLSVCFLLSIVVFPDASTTNKDNPLFPHRIWSYWKAPITDWVQYIFNTTHTAIREDWCINLLDESNLSIFLHNYSIPKSIELLPVQQQSDYIRLRLVEQYGGWWIDTSTLIKDSALFSEWYEQIVNEDASFFAFCQYLCPRKYLHNSVFYGKKHSSVLKAWLSEFEVGLEQGICNYIYAVNREGIALPNQLFYEYPWIKPYLYAYVCLKYVLERILKRQERIITRSAERYIWKMRIDCNLNYTCIREILSNEERLQHYPLTKFTRMDREELDPDSKKGSAISQCSHTVIKKCTPSQFLFELLYSAVLMSLVVGTLRDTTFIQRLSTKSSKSK